MQLQNEVRSNVSCKNVCALEKASGFSHGEKRCEFQVDSLEIAVMVIKKFNNDNSGEFGSECLWRKQQKFTTIIIIKFLPLTYHHSYFFATTMYFTSFSLWLSYYTHFFTV